MVRTVLAICLAIGCRACDGANDFFYVASTGDDRNAGTIDAPFATLQRAQQSAAAGDTVWIRGGTYHYQESQIARLRRGRAIVVMLDKSGEVGKPIRYWAFPNETPIFEFTSVKPNEARVTAVQVDGSWLHLKGLTFTGVQVTITGHTQSICVDNQGDHNVYETLRMCDGQAIGLWIGRGSHNLVLHCDAYRNHDYTSEDRRGGNVDGFGFHAPAGSVNNVFRGCRAWFNSDDGFDFINTTEPATIENCWAFYNGFSPDFKSLADGNGFKIGGYARAPASKIPAIVPRHIVRCSLAVRNKSAGFYANHHPGGCDWINNTAYRNSVNFNMLGRDRYDVNLDIDGTGHRMLNNLGLAGRREVANLNKAASHIMHNYFDLPIQVDDNDFLGLDLEDLIKPRQPDGLLPETNFLKLAPQSDLIDCGTDAGLEFFGKRPDLGAFESNDALRLDGRDGGASRRTDHPE
jgi:Right handed beta helix region